jgi:hypothetical protein
MNLDRPQLRIVYRGRVDSLDRCRRRIRLIPPLDDLAVDYRLGFDPIASVRDWANPEGSGRIRFALRVRKRFDAAQ